MSFLNNTARNTLFASNDAKPAREDLPKAEFWVNIGYVVQAPSKETEGEIESKFVSLPMGIPLDTMEPLTIGNSRNGDWVNFQSARNDLLKELQEEAKSLAPGGEVVVGGEDGSLAIQIRRVNGAATIVAATENPYSRQSAGFLKQ